MSAYDNYAPSTGYHRYGRQLQFVTPKNIHEISPDGYLDVPVRGVPWEWFGCIDKCGKHYEDLKRKISGNGNTAVGLFFEVAVTPNKVELDHIWWELMVATPGLKISLTVHDLYGNELWKIDEIDFSNDPKGGAAGCSDCSEGVDTFGKYRFDNSGDQMLMGRCNAAIVRLEILEEPEGGLLGSDCNQMPMIMFRGGLGYRSFCNIRDIVHDDCAGDLSCLDKCACMDDWNESTRKQELGL
jgi:hypothetical protein